MVELLAMLVALLLQLFVAFMSAVGTSCSPGRAHRMGPSLLSCGLFILTAARLPGERRHRGKQIRLTSKNNSRSNGHTPRHGEVQDGITLQEVQEVGKVSSRLLVRRPHQRNGMKWTGTEGTVDVRSLDRLVVRGLGKTRNKSVSIVEARRQRRGKSTKQRTIKYHGLGLDV